MSCPTLSRMLDANFVSPGLFHNMVLMASWLRLRSCQLAPPPNLAPLALRLYMVDSVTPLVT
jgi:hypothetical protein